MRSIRWLCLLTAVMISTACFFTWVSVNGNYFVGGFHSSPDSRFGEPGILHLVFSCIYILFLLLNKLWSLRAAFFVSAFNLAWAVRNFIVVSACSGGVCPEKHAALYIILSGSLLMILLISFVRVRTR